MAGVIIDKITKHFGEVVAVNNVSFEVKEAEFVSLLGPSGCGKTTTLRIIAGLEDLDKGKVFIGKENMTNVPVYKRNIGLMFQDYALFPHLNVYDNVAFGLKMRKIARNEIKDKVVKVLDLVGLNKMGKRMPNELSGGQQQRVALARTLVVQPRVLLLDEPLSNLDAKVRKEMRLEIVRIQKEMGITTILVTHDQEEALSVSDRIIIMCNGEIVEEGVPLDIYNRPNTSFVAKFMGQTNLGAGRLENYDKGLLTVSAGETGSLNFRIRSEKPEESGTEITFMIPRECMQIYNRIHDSTENVNIIDGLVQTASYVGGQVQYQCVSDGIGFTFSQNVQNEADIRKEGERVKLCFCDSEIHIIKSK